MKQISLCLSMAIMLSVSLNSFSISKLDRAQNHYNKGYTLLEKNKYSQALKEFNAAIEDDPTNPNYWDKRATVYFSMQNYTSAISDYTKAIILAPGVGIYYTERALAYKAIGNENAMLNDLTIAAQLGEPEAQKIMAIYIAAVNAQSAAFLEKNKRQTQKSLENRFGFKPGTLNQYM